MNENKSPSEIRKHYFREFGEYSSRSDPNFPLRHTNGQNHVSYTKDWPSGFELCADIAPRKNNITARICIRSTHMPAAYDFLHDKMTEITSSLSRELGKQSGVTIEWKRGVEGVLRLSLLHSNVSEPENWQSIFVQHLMMLQVLRKVVLPIYMQK
jgi:hypothetical protein